MIINQTKNKTLASIVFLADSPFKRMKGLLGEKSFKAPEAMVITPCNSVHTFFMRFPIDLLFIDKHSKVVKAVANLPSFRLTPIYLASRFVIELPAGTIHTTNTSEGDQIVIN
jgi:hypothetical protein